MIWGSLDHLCTVHIHFLLSLRISPLVLHCMHIYCEWETHHMSRYCQIWVKWFGSVMFPTRMQHWLICMIFWQLWPFHRCTSQVPCISQQNMQAVSMDHRGLSTVPWCAWGGDVPEGVTCRRGLTNPSSTSPLNFPSVVQGTFAHL